MGRHGVLCVCCDQGVPPIRLQRAPTVRAGGGANWRRLVQPPHQAGRSSWAGGHGRLPRLQGRRPWQAAQACRVCGNTLILCPCKGRGQKDITFDLGPPAITVDDRLTRWQDHVLRNPLAGRFDTQRYVSDMRRDGLLATFQRCAKQQRRRISSLVPLVCTSCSCRCWATARLTPPVPAS